ncbi:MAG: 3-dehydroquinate synthase [Candidatus Sericytochromatia bacterium]|nr:MAG: 3-dehydroquinate synthase [Candidatus Sericytochromatia bacterium]
MLEISELNVYFIDDFNYLKFFFKNNKYSKIFILVDKNTNKYCLHLIEKYINEFKLIKIKDGEENKNIDSCNIIWNNLIKNNADRKSLLINLGGGIITDIGSFCASTYKRGIDFINIPTTLLAQVDASIGGKCGINFKNIKNSIGLFVNPRCVFIIKDFLQTLSKREYNSGFAEMIKHSLLKSKNDFEDLLIKYSNLTIVDIYNSVKIKYEIVKKDYKENGLRKILNFGHTIGHAIETLSINKKNRLLHGEALIIGIICELYISHKVLDTDINLINYIIYKLIKMFGYFDINSYSIKEILEIIKNDKKNFYENINFSLMKDIGNFAYDINVPEKIIKESINYYKNLN